MMNPPIAEITRNRKGYYTLTVDGLFSGNFDTFAEAVSEYERDRSETSVDEKGHIDG